MNDDGAEPIGTDRTHASANAKSPGRPGDFVFLVLTVADQPA
jgi:hypothetical protein